MCEVLSLGYAQAQYPICQTYVDTCLVGCLEHGGEAFADDFIRKTDGWNEFWINDRTAPKYPRLAKIDADMVAKIDRLLDKHGLLSYRQEAR